MSGTRSPLSDPLVEADIVTRLRNRVDELTDQRDAAIEALWAARTRTRRWRDLAQSRRKQVKRLRDSNKVPPARVTRLEHKLAAALNRVHQLENQVAGERVMRRIATAKTTTAAALTSLDGTSSAAAEGDHHA